MPATDPPDGWRPVPDPTELTDRAIGKALERMHEYVDSQLQVRDERLRGMDEAIRLRSVDTDMMTRRIDEKVGAHCAVAEQRFFSVDRRFAERDKALEAALVAQKEAIVAQELSSSKAIDKAELNTAETIRNNQQLSATRLDALTKTLDELKTAVSRMEAAKLGARDDRASLYAGLAALAALVSVLVVIGGLILSRGTV